MKNHNNKFWKISCFIIVFSLYTNVVNISAQSAGEAQLYNDLYNFGYDLGMEMMREASKIKYTILNNTGSSIQEIYISLSSSDSWGQNLWQYQELFPSGYQIETSIDDVGPYDILIKDINGNEYLKRQVRITSNLFINFTKEDKVKKGILDRAKNAWNSFWN